MNFKDYLNEDKDENLEEEYSKSSGYNIVTGHLTKLEKFLTPNSRLAKSIADEMGKGYLKDFAEMEKHMTAILGIWEDIDMDIERQ